MNVHTIRRFMRLESNHSRVPGSGDRVGSAPPPPHQFGSNIGLVADRKNQNETIPTICVLFILIE